MVFALHSGTIRHRRGEGETAPLISTESTDCASRFRLAAVTTFGGIEPSSRRATEPTSKSSRRATTAPLTDDRPEGRATVVLRSLPRPLSQAHSHSGALSLSLLPSAQSWQTRVQIK